MQQQTFEAQEVHVAFKEVCCTLPSAYISLSLTTCVFCIAVQRIEQRMATIMQRNNLELKTRVGAAAEEKDGTTKDGKPADSETESVDALLGQALEVPNP